MCFFSDEVGISFKHKMSRPEVIQEADRQKPSQNRYILTTSDLYLVGCKWCWTHLWPVWSFLAVRPQQRSHHLSVLQQDHAASEAQAEQTRHPGLLSLGQTKHSGLRRGGRLYRCRRYRSPPLTGLSSDIRILTNLGWRVCLTVCCSD